VCMRGGGRAKRFHNTAGGGGGGAKLLRLPCLTCPAQRKRSPFNSIAAPAPAIVADSSSQIHSAALRHPLAHRIPRSPKHLVRHPARAFSTLSHLHSPPSHPPSNPQNLSPLQLVPRMPKLEPPTAAAAAPNLQRRNAHPPRPTPIPTHDPPLPPPSPAE
jgi:hypothetical protein